MTYTVIKHIHITLVCLTFISFCLRFYWSLTQSPILDYKVTRTLPHIIDTTLLGAGLYLMILLQLWPNQHPWLATKLLCLIAYILFGTFAIKRAKSKSIKWLTGLCAITVFIYMIATAVYHNPLWFL